MSICIVFSRRNVPYKRIQIERLGIRKIRIRNSRSLRSPVRRNPSSQSVRIMPRPKIIESSFSIAFFAGEFVMIGIAIEELKFPTPRIVIRFRFGSANRIGDHRCGFQMIREIVGNRIAGKVLSRYAFTIEEDIFGLQVARKI